MMKASANGIPAASALPASCGSDIKLTNGEIALGIGDFELVEGGACIAQDFMERLKTDAGALFYALNFGAGLPRFLQAGADRQTATELKAAIMGAAASEPRIIQDSISVKVSFDGGMLSASITAELEDSKEPLNLTLRLGEELEIYGSRT